MQGYYSEKLSGERLRLCYELASPRVKQYLEAEIAFVLGCVRTTDSLLDLGCGFGRVAVRLAAVGARVVGIDTSSESLAMARRLAGSARCEYLRMDATHAAFRENAFDLVICVQNGICAFAVEPERLLREALRITRPGGRILVSSYAANFWPERLQWFESQAAAGLVGPIDYDRTGDGTIVCRDGFRAGTFSPEAFRALCLGLGVDPVLVTVDDSSLFCDIRVPGAGPRVACPTASAV